MRLYSRLGAGAVDDPVHGHFEPDEDGGFPLPDELAGRLHKFHHRREAMWETEDERSRRLNGAELARRRDPETLFSVVASIADAMKQLSSNQAGSAPNPDVADLAAQVKALTEQLAALQAQPPAPAGDDSGPAPAVPAEPEPAAKSPRARGKAAPAES
jgi:hypothetical protein